MKQISKIRARCYSEHSRAAHVIQPNWNASPLTLRVRGDIRHLVLAGALTCLAALAAACAQPAPTAAPARAAVVRIEIAEADDAVDIPRHMALDTLRAQGYAIETVTFDEPALLFVGMERDELDLGTVADVLAWRAIYEGAPAFTFLDESANSTVIAAARAVRECADLDGARVGLGSLGGAAATLLYRYVDMHCPEAEPQYLTIPGTSSRLAALLAGELDAAAVPMFSFATLDPADTPGHHVLFYYADEFPALSPASSIMRRGLAATHPETAKDIIRAVLQARRAIQDPDVLTEEIVNRLRLAPAQARAIAEDLLARKMWDVNGRYTLATLQEKIDWYAANGDVPADMRAEDVADLSYLEAVLEEIGRQ